jgi:hypothetical protein
VGCNIRGRLKVPTAVLQLWLGGCSWQAELLDSATERWSAVASATTEFLHAWFVTRHSIMPEEVSEVAVDGVPDGWADGVYSR